MAQNKMTTLELLQKIERAENLAVLKVYGEWAKEAPLEDKELLRAIYAARLKQLRQASKEGSPTDETTE